MAGSTSAPCRVKEEVLSDEEEVFCRLCNKGFLSTVALRNHASMEHVETFASGDPDLWTKPASEVVPMPKRQVRREPASVPTSITGLASSNISYIIVKSEDLLTANIYKTAKKPVQKRPKEVQPITGPFECLEASPLGADGVCHQIFFSCCEYSMHARHEHTKRKRAPRCQVCERTLPTRLPGSGELVYSCETCGANFDTDVALEIHMAKLHVREKPYQCNICHKRFTQQGGVQQHMRMHTGERPFPCTVCDKAFTQKSGRDQHMRTHTKHKPYRCVVCSKSFIQSVHLKQHMRTHTNVAPFQCGICNKRFKQSSHLTYHLKNHSPDGMTAEQRAKYADLVGQFTTQAHDQDQEVEQEHDEDQVEYTTAEVEVDMQDDTETYVIEGADDMLQYQQYDDE